MQQVKIFKGVESSADEFEKDINDWLAGSGANVVNIFGNIAPQTIGKVPNEGQRRYEPSDLFIVVLYEKG